MCVGKKEKKKISYNASEINAALRSVGSCAWGKVAFNLPVMLSFFFFFFLCVGCISPFLPKNNLFDYQVVMNILKNSCKYIWSIGSIWCIFAP